MIITTKMAESAVHCLWHDLIAAGFQCRGYAEMPAAKAFEITVDGDAKAVKAWLKASRYDAKVKR